jgi:hypothetical protein
LRCSMHSLAVAVDSSSNLGVGVEVRACVKHLVSTVSQACSRTALFLASQLALHAHMHTHYQWN